MEEKIKLSHKGWAKLLAYVLYVLLTLVFLLSLLEFIEAVSCLFYTDGATVTHLMSSDVFQLVISAGGSVEKALDWAGASYSLRYICIFTAILSAAGIVALVVFLVSGAGRRTATDEAKLTFLDKLPFDLSLCAMILIGIFFAMLIQESLWLDVRYWVGLIAVIALCLIGIELLVLEALLSLTRRARCGTLLKNNVLYWLFSLCRRILRFFWRKIKAFFGSVRDFCRLLPLMWKCTLGIAGVMILLLIFIIGIANGSGFWLLMLVVTCLVGALAVMAAAYQMKTLQQAGERLASGDFDSQISTERLFFDFRKHAENLNSIGDGMARAVELRLKSERLKTELITNVSHDIKTPLTSIINYVDLLEKPHTPEQEAEYLEVLDRQSQRLKKLIEDLVEASKASTGNIAVNIVPTNTREIINQSLAEYASRLEAEKLTVVSTMPDTPITVLADGRLLWRVMDNLFNNVCKYALPGTRVYLGVRAENTSCVITLKNISRDELNVSADELMERFVRGDSSRSTEGSGLGLNIAKSLVELQHGAFTLSTDGDLFKAEITLPTA